MPRKHAEPTACWLMKTEPAEFSIDDLQRVGIEPWDGVRNHQVRNFFRDTMKVGDRVLVYHSNAKPPGIVGLAQVAGGARPDPTAFVQGHPHYDPKSDPDDPRWLLVDVRFVAKFAAMLTLARIKADPELADMLVVRRGMRLSVQPVEPADYDHIVRRCSSTEQR